MGELLLQHALKELRHILLRSSEEALQNRIKNANILRLVTAYREHGHKSADVDPLKIVTKNSQGVSRILKKLSLEKVRFG
ncbi:putative 2-oxoglutarate dehydrogenase E1 component DHKTD1, mitochondrial [Desmophyllum pertusum]|uniref:2-oxoglutarate dehydrogenase E1 component DHKTD1, mitochondrial n=1 Tax=Desmophyllum pertusum TaxID=174260 RepID=A0A9X0D2N4_9CNID|nr:putative 2-oxoglutarate dehydrogenase E1 component DHKTD1, mitochondrial [Desmophyllum pertusum]